MAHDDESHRKPKAEDWGVLNAIPELPPMEIDLPRREVARSEPPAPYDPLLPSPDVLVDVPIKKHRSFAGLVFLLVIVVVGGALFLVMRADIASNRVRGNPEGINLGTPQTIAQAGAVPKEIVVPPPPAKTLLRLESDPPGARVVVNGNPVGAVTPTAVQTFVGQPVLVQMYADGHRPASKELTVSGSEGSVSLALEAGRVETATIEVTSDPVGAFVEYMGVVVGETPVKLEGVPADHPVFFRLKKEGHYAHTVRYEAGPGESRRVGVKMVPDDGERVMAAIFVDSVPYGARIERVEGGTSTKEGMTGHKTVEVFARLGYPLVLEGSAPQFGRDRVVIDVNEPTYTVLMRLPPPPSAGFGTVSLSGPKELSVYLDREEQDALPLRKVKLTAGEHELVVVDPTTRARGTLKFKVGADEDVSRTVKKTDDGRIVIE